MDGLVRFRLSLETCMLPACAACRSFIYVRHVQGEGEGEELVRDR